jgi:parvulin-like peptidyl-prolyl isomerase
METILQQLRANPSVSNFSDLAGKYSEDASAKSGGDLGWVPQGMLSPALDEALFKLKPGQISDVVKTEFGYHVIMCEGIEPAGTAPFEDVKEEVVKKLLVQKQPQVIAALKALVQDLRRASAITIYRENL